MTAGRGSTRSRTCRPSWRSTRGRVRLRPGRVTYFELADDAGISEKDLVALLDLCEEQGSDTPGEWADSCGWEDYPVWERARRDLAPLRRLASINDLQFSWVDHDEELIPMLVDEDGFVAHKEIAATHLDFTGYSFVGWSAFNHLVLLRPGLACSAPTGDALTEGGDDGFFLINYPDRGTTEERSSAIADWLLRLNFEFYAALNLEPLDPAGTLDEDARRESEIQRFPPPNLSPPYGCRKTSLRRFGPSSHGVANVIATRRRPRQTGPDAKPRSCTAGRANHRV